MTTSIRLHLVQVLFAQKQRSAQVLFDYKSRGVFRQGWSVLCLRECAHLFWQKELVRLLEKHSFAGEAACPTRKALVRWEFTETVTEEGILVTVSWENGQFR